MARTRSAFPRADGQRELGRELQHHGPRLATPVQQHRRRGDAGEGAVVEVGRAVELGFKALETAGNPRPLPYSLPGNRPFFESAKGLVHALLESGRKGMAVDTAKKIAALDPADPLGLIRLAAGGEGETA